MMQNSPFVSIVILTRDRAESLARALTAVSGQDYPRFEIIVVDNGSMDHTRQVASRFKVQYMYSPAKNGISKSRQLGIDASNGEVIAMCDDDCEPGRDWLKILVSTLSRDETIAVVAGEIRNVDFPAEYKLKGKIRMTKMNGKMEFVESAEQTDFFGNANLAVRKSIVQNLGGYDPFYRAGREELDLAIRFERAGYKVAYAPEAVVNHYFTGVNYKRGRFFYDLHLMRLYFYLKHFCPRSFSAWITFTGRELALISLDLYRWMRGFVSSLLRFRLQKLSNLCLEIFNIISARIAIPSLMLLASSRKKKEFERPSIANESPV